MKTWKIPVAWEVCGLMEIQASTLEEAMDIAKNDDTIPLPDGYYIDGSFDLDCYEIEIIRECYNDNQKDDNEEDVKNEEVQTT